MKTVFFLVGVRGSGKTTLTNSASTNRFHILKPSTTRSKRSKSENEYHFTDSWESNEYAWEIEINDNKYGMLKSEIEQIPDNRTGLSVFDPSNIDFLKAFQSQFEGDVLTIGLNTISSIDEQHSRVSKDDSRMLAEIEFEEQSKIVKRCDVVLSGGPKVLKNALDAIADSTSGRGGLLPKSIISALFDAGVLLEGVTTKREPASYDLRLGDDAWCQGDFSPLSSSNPTLKIPAYSYAIVKAKEIANLPSFITARFDLKNSLFFKGVILSNGPQVDPGYRGALFCMLYNGSDQPIGLTRKKHFATIEFMTVAGFDPGYSAKYQDKKDLVDFMPSDNMVSEGGRILERTEEKITSLETSFAELRSNWNTWRNALLGILTLIFAAVAMIVSPVIPLYYNTLWDTEDTEEIEKLKQENNFFKNRLLEIENKLQKPNQSLSTHVPPNIDPDIAQPQADSPANTESPEIADSVEPQEITDTTNSSKNPKSHTSGTEAPDQTISQ